MVQAQIIRVISEAPRLFSPGGGSVTSSYISWIEFLKSQALEDTPGRGIGQPSRALNY